MRFVDLIEKKKKGLEHTKEEIEFIVSSVTKETVPDYQISAWLMAVYFQGMTEEETACFTGEIIKSGEVIDLSSIGSHIADKHSTGGVGDKVTVIQEVLSTSWNLFRALERILRYLSLLKK